MTEELKPTPFDEPTVVGQSTGVLTPERRLAEGHRNQGATRPVPHPDAQAHAAPAAPVAAFDFVQHDGVEELKAGGLPTDLGPKYGGMIVAIAPFDSKVCIIARESYETAAILKLGLPEGEDLPGEYALMANKAAVLMAIKWAKMTMRGTPEVLEIARRHGWQVEGDVITLHGKEEGDHVRELFKVMMTRSNTLLLHLVRLSRGIQKLKDAEIAKLGKDFIFGRHVPFDLDA